MAVFIELTTDAFQTTFNAQSAAGQRARRAGTNNARRPTRGLEIKDDTYAIIKVVDSTGMEIPLIDSGSQNGTNTQYTNFILQSVDEARMEKQQIVETFGDAYIYFFGESPRFLDITAVLVNSNDFNWEAEWWANWDQYFRGTKSVEMGARTYLFYDDNVVEGYMLMARAHKVAEQPLSVQLQWRMFVTNSTNVSFVGDPNFPVRGSLILPSDVTDVNQATSSQQAVDATLAANLQQSGFGGGNSLVQALQQGLDPSSVSPSIQGILSNATEAFGGLDGLTRNLPVRTLIFDNKDEYTGAPPSAVDLDNGYDPSLSDENQEAQDLTSQSAEVMQGYGVDELDPDTMNSLGLGPKFGSAGVAIGINAGVGVQATFGASVSAGASFGVSSLASTGIGAGFGFSGVVGSSIGYGTGYDSTIATGAGYSAGSTVYSGSSQQFAQLQDQLSAASYMDILDQNFANSQGANVSSDFENGVQVGGSVTMGTGIAGGVNGGIGPSSLFSATPNTYVGSAVGIGGGASLSVGGVVTAFAMVSASGTLDPTGFDVTTSSFAQVSF